MARRDTHTADLLSWEPPEVAVGYGLDVIGRGGLDNQIPRLLSRALDDVKDEKGLSRAVIAGLMTLELHRNISKDMLDKWTSEASISNRIPLDAFIALVKVTEAADLLGFIPGILGFAVVPQKYAEIVQLYLLEEKEREINAAKTAVQARLRGIRP